MTTLGNPRRCGERGSVTAEFAVGLPGVVATVLLVLGTLVAGADYIQCQEAARAGVREAVLHASAQPAAAVAQTVAGPAARITVTTDGTWVRVRVVKPVLFTLNPVTISAELTAPMEQP